MRGVLLSRANIFLYEVMKLMIYEINPLGAKHIIVVFNLFYIQVKSMSLGIRSEFKHKK